MSLCDTIAAVSTPRGKGGVAMIRISGEEAIAVADKIFKRPSGVLLADTRSALMCRGVILDPAREVELDDGMAAVFRAPASFTGEDTVEIYCHGGALVTERVLTAALVSGARAAEAGEFTRRAFVSGKLSLSEAESLGALLEAKNEGQLRLARGGMRGNLTAETERVYSALRSVMSGIYAAIDFPDEDLNEFSREEIGESVEMAIRSVTALADTYRTGHAVSEGIRTVICGRANAGKSSVYNRIIGYDAAIVTDIEGTTRDVLRQTATLGGVTLLLSDTAGIRETCDKVESIGIGRALEELDAAELVIAVFDSSRSLGADDDLLLGKLCQVRDGNVPCIVLLNKADLEENAETVSRLKESFELTLSVSAASGEGFDQLAKTTAELFINGDIDMDNDAVVTGARQYAALVLAKEALESSLAELQADTPLDLSCIGIETAMSALAELDGRQIGEDIVSEIFSKFCVGK